MWRIRSAPRGVVCALVLAASGHAATATPDDELYRLARTDLPAFARQVSVDAPSELGRAQAIVRWLARNFEWKATDYQRRTVQQIIERRGGNCNELAMVATSAMQALNIRLRQVHEVNIQAPSDRRAATARQMVADKGVSYSVFGRRHNDHIWLELYDSAAKDWLPADPSSGLVGLDDWMQGRVGFGKRVSLNPITDEMIVPIAIFAADEGGKFTINRTQHYLVDAFDAMYGGKLHANPSWKQWTEELDGLDDKVAGAFAGSVNLHDYAAQIDTLADTYERLRAHPPK
jgi:hypothetical protein